MYRRGAFQLDCTGRSPASDGRQRMLIGSAGCNYETLRKLRVSKTRLARWLVLAILSLAILLLRWRPPPHLGRGPA